MRCKRLSTRWRLQVAATTEAANALIADALEFGLRDTVLAYLRALSAAG